MDKLCKMNIGRLLMLAAVIIALLPACRQHELSDTASGKDTLRLAWKIGNTRTILPGDFPVATKYDVLVVSSTGGPYSVSQTGLTGTELVLGDLPPDSFTVTVTARDALGTAIASGTGSADLTGTSAVSVAITLSYLVGSGTGSVDLSISFSGNVIAPSSVSATVVDPSGSSSVKALTGSGHLWNLSIDPALAGTHEVYIQARAGNGTAFVNEAVVVIPTVKTIGTFEITLSDLTTAVYSGLVSDFAGPSAAPSDGTGKFARFSRPYGCAYDGTYAYVTDTRGNTVRRITVSTGEVITVAGSPGAVGSADGVGSAARFNGPKGIVFYGADLYVVDSENYTIRKLVLSGDTATVTTIAGAAGSFGSLSSNIGINALSARFSRPTGIAADVAAGNLYVADTGNNKIVAIGIDLATPQAALMAGSGSSGSTDSSSPLLASFAAPTGIIAVGGQVYVTSGNSVRRIGVGGVTTVAGSRTAGNADGTGSAASFNAPEGLASDGTSLYVSDTGNALVRKIDLASGAVMTFAGGNYDSTDFDGIGPLANFYSTAGITLSGSRLIVCDPMCCVVRAIDAGSATVTTIAGSVPWGALDGSAAVARFAYPYGVATDGVNLYVTDTENATIRRVSLATGEVTTFAGSPGVHGNSDGSRLSSLFDGPGAIATDGERLFVADTGTIRMIDIADGTVTTLAGSSDTTPRDGTGSSAGFGYIHGIAVLGGDLYVTDGYAIRKVSIATREVSLFAGSVTQDGSVDGSADTARFKRPFGIVAIDDLLYVADGTSIRCVLTQSSEVVIVAGSLTLSGLTNSTGTSARFRNVDGIATDGKCLYAIESSNVRIRKIEISTGAVTALAGVTSGGGYANGLGTAARFTQPMGIATDGTRLYVADSGNYAIRIIE